MVGQTNGGRDPNYQDKLILNVDEFRDKPARADWNYEKNKPLLPKMFSYGSPKKVWWICDKGHEWEATISSRVQGAGCPYCTSKKPTVKNNFENTYPDIAREWHPTRNEDKNPSDFTPRSGLKVWWICEKGHEWGQTIHNRTRGSGCPECYKLNRGKLIHEALLRKRGSLAERYPEIAKEWHPTRNGNLSPTDVLPRSDMKVWWLCENGHEYLQRLADKTTGSGYPKCYADSRATL